MSGSKKPRATVDEDVKAKFRAALDAKSRRRRRCLGPPDHSKVDHAHVSWRPAMQMSAWRGLSVRLP